MPVKTINSRPSLPYAPTQSLPNNTRFGILTTTQRPPTAEMLDAEFNALTDDVNMLAVAINDVQAGSIPGAKDILNAKKVLITDGERLSWTYVTDAQLEPGAVVEQALALQSVTTPKIGNAAVTADKIDTDAVITEKLSDNAVTTPKIAPNAVDTTKMSSGNSLAQTVLNADGAGKASFGPLGARTVGTAQLVTASVTNPIIAPLAVDATKITSNGAAIGTVLTSGGGSQATWSAIPTTGQVLQIVSYTYGKRTTTPGPDMSSFAVPFALTIVPLSSNSSIFIYIGTSLASIASIGGYLTMALFKNGAQMVFDNNNGILFSGAQTPQMSYGMCCFSRLVVDKNNTLNAITYELRGADASGHGIILNQSFRFGVITSSSLYAVEVQI